MIRQTAADMMRQLAVVTLIAAAMILPAQKSGLAAPSLAGRSITSHGLRLRLTIPNRAVPPDALIPVTITGRNVSQHPLTLQSHMVACEACYLSVREVDAANNLVPEPTALHGFPFIPIGPPAMMSLTPGQVLTRHLAVVTWSPDLVADAQVEELHGDRSDQYVVSSPPVPVPRNRLRSDTS